MWIYILLIIVLVVYLQWSPEYFAPIMNSHSTKACQSKNYYYNDPRTYIQNIAFKCPYDGAMNGVSSPFGVEVIDKEVVQDVDMPLSHPSMNNGIVPMECTCAHKMAGNRMNCGCSGCGQSCEGYEFV